MKTKRFVYSPKYFFIIENHVFQTRKFYDLYNKLINEKVIYEREIAVPEIYPELYDDLALVHTSKYLDDLLQHKKTSRTLSSELPLNKDIVDRFLIATSGTILATKLALSNGYGINLSCGFHHAFPDYAEGFCYINDVAVSAAKLLNEKSANQVLIVDLDLHQGNATAVIFQNEPRVFTFSMHQESCYPKKEKSDYDIGLPDFTGDESYLSQLKLALDEIFMKFNPQFVIYLAGVDPFYKDLLGSLRLTFEGLIKRDRMVIEKCFLASIPISVVLAGGYAEDPNDTVQAHYNTCLTLKECESLS